MPPPRVPKFALSRPPPYPQPPDFGLGLLWQVCTLICSTAHPFHGAGINKPEAANSNPNPFTFGLRPFIGWVCGAGFALQFVVGPLGEWISMLAGHPVKFPQLDLGTMMPLLFGMLGLGAFRTAEKVQGVAR